MTPEIVDDWRTQKTEVRDFLASMMITMAFGMAFGFFLGWVLRSLVDAPIIP